MNIKIHPTKNEYLYAGNELWVRNFTKNHVKPYDINEKLFPEKDLKIFIENESKNNSRIFQKIDSEDITHEKIIIVNDGYQFDLLKKDLEFIPNDVCIIGVNDTLKEWNINKRMNYYIVNNPYKECMDYLPEKLKTNPRLIASTKTNPLFIEFWKGLLYMYTPVNNRIYSSIKTESEYQIDDYRNTICAAIGLSYRFNVKKLLLFCCDEMSNTKKPGMVQNRNYWIYPQQIIAHNLCDANLFWLKSKKINIGHYNMSLHYNNSKYISKEEILKFFNEENND